MYSSSNTRSNSYQSRPIIINNSREQQQQQQQPIRNLSAFDRPTTPSTTTTTNYTAGSYNNTSTWPENYNNHYHYSPQPHLRSIINQQPLRSSPTPTPTPPPPPLLTQHHHHHHHQNRNISYSNRPDSRSSSINTHQPPPHHHHHPQPQTHTPPNPYAIPNTPSEQWPRQWAWTGVEIPIHNLRALRDSIEQPLNPLHREALSPEEHDTLGSSGEVLSYSFGSDRWKVEVVKGHNRRPSAPSTPTKTTHQPGPNRNNNTPNKPSPSGGGAPLSYNDQERLSLYLTCHELEVDWPVSRSISTSILIAIKEPRIPVHRHPITDLGSSAEGWIWRTYCDEHRFERERELWECHDFPALSSLLDNPRVALFDSFILSIQIGSPATVSIPQIPNASYVPHSILDSLESLIDDPNTSDLQILVTEIEEEEADSPAFSGLEAAGGGALNSRFRKRILYAHSSILTSRSDYFGTMLADEAAGGGWAEAGSRPAPSSDHSLGIPPFGRKLGLIRIADFDFVTVYWLIRWLYSNRIFFSDEEDVRKQCQLGAILGSYQDEALRAGQATDGQAGAGDGEEEEEEGEGEEDRGGNGEGNGERWEWQRFGEPVVGPAGEDAEAEASRLAHPFHPASRHPSTLPPFPPFSASPKPAGSPVLSTSEVATGSSSGPGHTGPDAPTGSRASRPAPHRSATWIPGDPHPHPVQMMPKASAFSIYRLAHRYELHSLKNLAITHLSATLNPASAFPILLASFVFPELHAKVKAYCLANYFEILSQPEFSRCYSEVGDGLWEHGGEVLLSFTMSLMPGPAAAAAAANPV
ncbi:hypothetical protein PGT21_025638 [Puccinia graminis f. sp. tritici]|uniref:BTB domain-containing protein n=1 Tax=Puccinia graminis f. sp. tritici TaxID=56615 RepID=A0A5B0R0J2_PUCGR|nr:hypothetical protein PGT21_025638 [Puccinia graminis f. sp. tritici]KAA1118565.1 hypothetical protein PGTUg99_008359 [Puccinia graminis f. sp. tritici]